MRCQHYPFFKALIEIHFKFGPERFAGLVRDSYAAERYCMEIRKLIYLSMKGRNFAPSFVILLGMCR